MPFLKRSKSQMVGNVSKSNRPQEGQQETQAQVQAPNAIVTPLPSLPTHHSIDPEAKKDRRRSRFERRSSIFGRAKSVDAPRRTSATVDRPRTANRISEEEPDMPFRAGFLGVENETIAIQSGGDTYNFPTPSSRLPPHSAKHTMHSASPAAGSSGRATPIGVAIGSPSQTPPTWQRSYTAGHVGVPEHRPALVGRANTSASPLRQDTAGAPNNIRKKKSGWKTLGGFFGRKAAKPSAVDSFDQVQAPQQHTMSSAAHEFARRAPAAASVARPLVETPKASLDGAMRSPNSISSHHSRTPSVNRGIARFEARAEADRKSFMPNIESKMARSPSRPRRENMPTAQARALEVIRDTNTPDGPKEVTISRQTAVRSASGPAQSQTCGTPRTPKLDTDIPDGGMERYSVMFEKLLEPKRQSILERRQSKARRVQTSSLRKDLPATPEVEQAVTTAIREVPASSVPQRSVTSPHLNRVASLSIRTGSKPAEKPQGAQEAKAVEFHRPRPLTRSKTAPPGVSPVARNFSRPKTATVTSSDSEATPDSPIYGENSLPPTPTSVATTMAEHDGITVMLHDPMPTVRHQPSGTGTTWDLLTHTNNQLKPIDLSPASSDNSRAAKPQHISAAYPRIKSPQDLDRQIVQVSVARQVSVSRARRQVERAHESKQPLRPRVVDLTAAQVKDRKSTYVSIEGGEE